MPKFEDCQNFEDRQNRFNAVKKVFSCGALSAPDGARLSLRRGNDFHRMYTSEFRTSLVRRNAS